MLEALRSLMEGPNLRADTTSAYGICCKRMHWSTCHATGMPDIVYDFQNIASWDSDAQHSRELNTVLKVLKTPAGEPVSRFLIKTRQFLSSDILLALRSYAYLRC